MTPLTSGLVGARELVTTRTAVQMRSLWQRSQLTLERGLLQV
jgi:hypothetical protein